MQFPKILTPIAIPVLRTLVLSAWALMITVQPSCAQSDTNRADAVLLDMQQAFRKGDKKQLTALLPQARNHPLEAWAAYWELKARLEEAPPQEIQNFLARYAGTYQEDRLRNDWLLLLGQRRDWSIFAAEHPNYRMGDDREVRCYALIVDFLRHSATAPPDLAADVRRNWYAQREAGDGCAFAADRLHEAGQLSDLDIWRKARLAAEQGQLRATRMATSIVTTGADSQVTELMAQPAKYLKSRIIAASRLRKELVVLALVRIAADDPTQAAQLLDSKWSVHLSAEERNWTWGVIGKQAAMHLSSDALTHYAQVSHDSDLTDEMLAWKTRAALRAGQWKLVAPSIRAMSDASRTEPVWVYWHARALLESLPSSERMLVEISPSADPVAAARLPSAIVQARQLLDAIASPQGFYESLALEELGQRITAPPPPPPPTEAEQLAARQNPALLRALYAIQIGLRPEGVREWNYATNLHDRNGMNDRELLAAADLACQREVWDRCINTSERTKSFFDAAQRFPMPHRAVVLQRSRDIGLDPAYVYGLIRQESRFVTDARSGVGASGLMQVMPATARWTAKKIGMTNFNPEQLADRDTNIAIGSGYLKLVLDSFEGSMPLAAAAYNAGPTRPRAWRNGPVVEGAIWAENVPFNETRDYVKKVLANTTQYAAVITGQPQSLKARLGYVGPAKGAAAAEGRDLP
jgi:soluble lytic murein transglycosylase